MSRSLFHDYLRSTRSLWGPGYWSTWQPAGRRVLGEVGTVSNGQFIGVDDLERMRMPFEVVTASERADLIFDGAGEATVTYKANGAAAQGFSALTQADAGALVAFARANSLLMSLTALKETRIRSVPTLAQAIVKAYWLGEWKRDYVVITHLVHASRGTILASGSAGSQVELRASVGLGAGGPITLADLSGGVSLARSERMGLQLVAESGLTPFFQVFRLRIGWLGAVDEQYGAPQPTKGSTTMPPPLPSDLDAMANEEPERVLESVDQIETVD